MQQLFLVLGILLGVVLVEILPMVDVRVQFNSDLAGLATPRAASAVAAHEETRSESRAANSPYHNISWVAGTRWKRRRAGKAKERSRRPGEGEESDTKVGKVKHRWKGKWGWSMKNYTQEELRACYAAWRRLLKSVSVDVKISLIESNLYKAYGGSLSFLMSPVLNGRD